MQAKDNFQLIREKYIPEYDSNFVEYEHKKTRAKLILIQNDDENKVFNITFRTPVSDSTGVPHILEHSVLNGSQKYPVKEPFVELIKSSQATFINALTYPDRTCYPVASTNDQDINNLVEVYLDAVFKPNISEQTFLQEGWHYHKESDRSNAEIKGVVYNEMKGVYSNPDSIFVETIMNNLSPENTYQHDSGGNPEKIPDLTYEQFIGFYNKFYHPSNSYIFYYGNDKSDKIFNQLEEYLGQYEFSEKSISDSVIEKQDLKNTPKKIEITYDPGEDESAKSQTAISWLFPDKYSKLEIGIMEYLLIGTPAAPLYKTLIESGLGSELSAGSGVESELIQPFFSIGLKDVDTQNTSKVIELVHKTLNSLADNGFSENQIKAAININEFYLREYNTGSTPKGLSMIFEMVSNWIYGVDPINEIAFEDEITAIKTRNSDYFQTMIRDLFINNKNTLVLTSNPQKGLNEKIKTSEQDSINKYMDVLTDEEKSQLIKTTKKLIESQNQLDKPEDLEKLPKLLVGDLDKKSKLEQGQVQVINDVEVVYSHQNTSGISYINLGFDITNLPLYYYRYIPLLGSTFKKLSTKNHSIESLNEYINIYTGGISSELFNTESDRGLVNQFFIKSKSTNDNINHIFEIFNEIAFEQILDNKEKIKQIIDETVSGFKSDIITDGRFYGSLIISSTLNKNSQLSEIKNGITQYNFLRGLQIDFDNNWSQILSDLIELKKYIFTKKNLIIGLTSNNESISYCNNHIEKLISNLPDSYDIANKEYSFNEYTDKTAIVIPTKVNNVCQGINLYKKDWEYNGHILPITKLINMNYLWNEVRVKGGAYGSACGFDKYDGEFIITSWRDPNSTGTFDVYNQISDFLSNNGISTTEINNYIVSSIGAIDRYKTAPQKGYSAFINHLMGKDIQKLQKERGEVFSFNSQDLKSFSNILRDFAKDSTKVIFTDKETAKKLDGFEIIEIK